MKPIKNYLINESLSLKYSVIYFLSTKEIKSGPVEDYSSEYIRTYELFANFNDFEEWFSQYEEDSNDIINAAKSLKSGECTFIKLKHIDVKRAKFDSILISCW